MRSYDNSLVRISRFAWRARRLQMRQPILPVSRTQVPRLNRLAATPSVQPLAKTLDQFVSSNRNTSAKQHQSGSNMLISRNQTSGQIAKHLIPYSECACFLAAGMRPVTLWYQRILRQNADLLFDFPRRPRVSRVSRRCPANHCREWRDVRNVLRDPEPPRSSRPSTIAAPPTSRAKRQHKHILSSSRSAKPLLAQECCLTIV